LNPQNINKNVVNEKNLPPSSNFSQGSGPKTNHLFGLSINVPQKCKKITTQKDTYGVCIRKRNAPRINIGVCFLVLFIVMSQKNRLRPTQSTEWF